LELYFYSGRNFLFAGDCQDQLGGYGQTDLWVSKRATRQDPWGVPQNLGPGVNSESAEIDPSISSDGLSLYFASYRESGGTYFDLYVTTRPTKNDPWGKAVKLGAPIPTLGQQLSPSISSDGLSLYFAHAPNPPATYDVYVSRRASLTAPWETPVPFNPVNSGLSEYGLSFAPGTSTLYFARSSNWNPNNSATFASTLGTYDIWQIEATPIVDFNGDGKVDLTDLVMLIQNWGTNNPLYDIGPLPLGDGKVDIEDLKVFMTYYEKANPPVKP
jgi:Tol biopolymer transport system component